MPAASASSACAAAGTSGAAPGDEHRPPRRGERGGELGDAVGVGRGRRPPAGERRTSSAPGGHVGHLHVERQVDDDGAPFPLRRPERRRDVGDRGVRGVDAHGLGADGAGQGHLVDVEVRQRLRRLGRQHEQRRAALGRLGDPGHGVRQARAPGAPTARRPCRSCGRRRRPSSPPRSRGGRRRSATRPGSWRSSGGSCRSRRHRRPGPRRAPRALAPTASWTFTVRRGRAPAPGCPSRRRSAAGRR